MKKTFWVIMDKSRVVMVRGRKGDYGIISLGDDRDNSRLVTFPSEKYALNVIDQKNYFFAREYTEEFLHTLYGVGLDEARLFLEPVKVEITIRELSADE